MVGLLEGVFVEGDLDHYGLAAAGFVQSVLPVFGVPWAVKLALDEAEAGECKILTPALLRCPLTVTNRLSIDIKLADQHGVGEG